MEEEIKNIIEATSMGKLEKEAVLNSLLKLHSVSERNDLKRKLDEEFTHYEPTMCNGIATMRECENGTYIEREDAHLIIDKYVR